MSIGLREVVPGDLDTFFEFQLDPDANHMAAFTSKDPTDRDAFDAHWRRIRNDEEVTIRTIVIGDATVVGHIASFRQFGEFEVTYWIGRAFWGNGHATSALSTFVNEVVRSRPLYARAAKDNNASIRVLQKCGFVLCGEDRGFANARGQEVDEIVLRLE